MHGKPLTIGKICKEPISVTDVCLSWLVPQNLQAILKVPVIWNLVMHSSKLDVAIVSKLQEELEHICVCCCAHVDPSFPSLGQRKSVIFSVGDQSNIPLRQGLVDYKLHMIDVYRNQVCFELLGQVCFITGPEGVIPCKKSVISSKR
eukprot:2720902-Amphidinium_carterae.1